LHIYVYHLASITG